MKYLAMVHTGEPYCVAIRNFEAIFIVLFNLHIYKKGNKLQCK